MNDFQKMLNIADTLLGEKGCPWDKKQTFFSLQKYFLEEVFELIDAIDSKDDSNTLDEMGDLLYTIVFLAKIAQIENRFTIKDVIKNSIDKLIRRHPHVFSDTKVNNEEDVVKNWDMIKKQEKTHIKRKTIHDEIPKTLPSLIKAQKIIHKMKKNVEFKQSKKFVSEEDVGNKIFNLIVDAEISGFNVEDALRRKIKEFLSEI